MSRGRLFASLAGVSYWVFIVAVCAGLAAHSAGGGAEGGVRDGVSASATPQNIPDVDYSTIWTDTVKRGALLRQVRGLGSLVRAENSTNLIARINLPAEMMFEVRPDETATVDTRKGLVTGHSIGLKPGSDETRTVYIGLDGPLPEGVVADTEVEATIDIEKIDDTLYVGRPANVPPSYRTPFASASEFKISKDGKEAERVVVKLGKPSATTIQVLGGLQAGDKIILSDMSAYDRANRLHLTDRMNADKH